MKAWFYWAWLAFMHPLMFVLYVDNCSEIPIVSYLFFYLVFSIVHGVIGVLFYRLPTFAMNQSWSLKRWLFFSSGMMLWCSSWIINVFLLLTAGSFTYS